MRITVGEFLKVNGGNLKAFVSVTVGDITIHDFRIVQKPNQRAWVSVPQVSWKTSGGKVMYKALLTIPEELQQSIEVAILSSWEREKDNASRLS